eukprot:1594464-Amphidinium_carterae.1
MKTVANVNGRRLTSDGGSTYEVSVEMEIESDDDGTASGMNSAAETLSTYTDALDQVDDSDLVTAMQVDGEVTVTSKESEGVSTIDDDISSDAAGADSDSVQTETTDIDLDSLLESIEATANAEDCSTTVGTEVTLGSVTSTVYAPEDLTSGTSVATNCSSVNTGYEGNLSLRCSYGTLTATSSCSALGCTDAIDVTLGDATSAITPTAEILSGLAETVNCSSVTSDYSGTFTMSCYEGSVARAEPRARVPSPQLSKTRVFRVPGQFTENGSRIRRP